MLFLGLGVLIIDQAEATYPEIMKQLEGMGLYSSPDFYMMFWNRIARYQQLEIKGDEDEEEIVSGTLFMAQTYPGHC